MLFSLQLAMLSSLLADYPFSTANVRNKRFCWKAHIVSYCSFILLSLLCIYEGLCSLHNIFARMLFFRNAKYNIKKKKKTTMLLNMSYDESRLWKRLNTQLGAHWTNQTDWHTYFRRFSTVSSHHCHRLCLTHISSSLFGSFFSLLCCMHHPIDHQTRM